MGRFESLLNFKFKNKKTQNNTAVIEPPKKETAVFSPNSKVLNKIPLSENEKNGIFDILKEFQSFEEYDTQQDYQDLLTITSEVKAITNQAVMLHGARIKKAQTILKNYKEGAFSAWLISIYGNRQTPYNFLQYYEFYTSIPQDLHPVLDSMPRQAVYTLASRAGELERKEKIVQKYKGETKQEILQIIRKEFPLDRDDKRLPNLANQSIVSLKRLGDLVSHDLFDPTESQLKILLQLLKEIAAEVKNHS